MWNKYLIEGELALLQSVGGEDGCVSSGPAFQTAGMKHAMELAALVHRQRAPQLFSNRGWESGLVLSPETSVFPEIKTKTHPGLKQIFLFSVILSLLWFSQASIKHWSLRMSFKTFFFCLKALEEMTKMLGFPFICYSFSLLRRAALLSLSVDFCSVS